MSEIPSYDLSIHSNPDARAWARVFKEVVLDKGIVVDEELMQGWFANAMMAMHDSPAPSPRAAPPDLDVLRAMANAEPVEGRDYTLLPPAPPAEAAPTRGLTEGPMASEEVPPASTNDAAGLGSHGDGNRAPLPLLGQFRLLYAVADKVDDEWHHSNECGHYTENLDRALGVLCAALDLCHRGGIRLPDRDDPIADYLPRTTAGETP